MNKQSSLKSRGSLLERAAEVYDFNAFIQPAPMPPRRLERDVAPRAPEPEQDVVQHVGPAAEEKISRQKQPIILSPVIDDVGDVAEPAEAPLELTDAWLDAPHPSDAFDAEMAPAPVPWPEAPARRGRSGNVDRESLLKAGFILPGAAATGLAEEFRIIKRQLLLGVNGLAGIADTKRQTILVCSAQADEGKTFCAVNLALSLATEKDLEVLLVDGDFAKPEVLSILGLESGPGLVDAIENKDADPEAFVIQTDIGSLSVLPAGRHANNVTELIASERTSAVLAQLTRRNLRRVVIFDSPPALMASPASVLATHVGQVMMVVRADKTTEAELREALGLLSGCDKVSLMLNGASFPSGGRRFGSYYGYGQ